MTAAAIAPATRSPRHTELGLGPLDRVRVSVAPAPMASLISLVVDALGGPRQGIAPEWIKSIRRGLPGDAARAVVPMFDRTGALLPACLTPLGIDGEPVSEQLARVADLSPDDLQEGVELMSPSDPPLPWQSALRQPQRWLYLYVRLLAAAWQAYSPIWQHSTALRNRETERIGAAVVTNGLDVLFAGLSNRVHYGPIRASILRALDRPNSMGGLADLLGAGPSTATYHCGQLAAAGLVLRQRAGREVRVERTPRGDALVDLLS